MKRRSVLVAMSLLLAGGGFLGGRIAMPASTAAAAPATEEAYRYSFLEIGKTYTFHWSDATQAGTLAEVPRAGWVKVKTPATGVEVPAVWVNLATVEWISEDKKK